MVDRSRRSRQWSFFGSLAFVGVLVIGAAVVVFGGGGSDDGQDATPGSSRSSASTAKGTKPTGCTATDRRQKVPTASPSDVKWQVWRGMALPRSRSAGPLRADERTGVTSCYAHTPLGAVMAAVNIGIRAGLAAPATTVVDEQVAEGPQKAQLRDVVRTYSPPDDFAQLAGFQVVSYRPSQAIVSVASGGGSNGYLESGTTVVWQDGTWRMVVSPDDLEPERSWQPVESLDGYVELEGVA